ncbi:WXG100 family type VII secretion target [Amycolatopsis sp. lyj-90]|uniref:WXG100 family type VII secretion target n=1 Tax=Amycolatopsis sp. lyj-90 TaxID=2789285 RepID=UPI00397B4FDC
MAENFRLDPVALERVVKALGSASEEFKTAFTQLIAVLDQHEGCWGTDQIGTAFENRYQTPAVTAKQVSDKVKESVENLPEVLQEASRTFRELDQENAKKIDQLMAEYLSQGKE